MLPGSPPRTPPSGYGWGSPGCPAAPILRISSTTRPSTTGRATPMRAPTAAIGPTTIAASDCSAGPRRNWRPDLLHVHDWHAGLAPAYLAAHPPPEARVPTLFTVHNLAYRGLFAAMLFPELALPPGFFAIDGVELFGLVSFLKAGLFYADRLTTVSPTYAREIQTPAFGWGLDGLLRSRAGLLTGILNGVDRRIWDPQRDDLLPRTYSAEDAPAGKRAAKAALH